MDVLFCFDSEDYLTPEAADAEKWWADELSARGLRATFQCVGELVRSLQRRGRTDVLSAIARHDIRIHTDFHSLPPTHPEALEGRSLEDGIDYVTRTEASAFAALETAFGRVPISYCSPGDSWTPATLLAMARMGVKVFCNDRLLGSGNAPYWYCGLLTLAYGPSFDDCFAHGEQMEARFRAEVEGSAARVGSDGILILYSHPCRLVTAAFWDAAFFGGVRRPLADCPPAPLRPPGEVQTIKDSCRRLLDWVQSRPGVRFTDLATVYKEWRSGRRTLMQLLDECSLAPGEEGRLLLDAYRSGYLAPDDFVAFSYTWPLYPPGFTGRGLLEQARELAWTSSPARRGVASAMVLSPIERQYEEKE